MALPPEYYVSLFSGAGGLDLAVRLAVPNARSIGYCEREIGAARILVSRMEDGSLDEAPIWSDLRTFPCRLYRGRVAGVVGGFPCPDYSCAGKRAGIAGEHGQLWYPMRDTISELEPDWCLLENVPGLLIPHALRRWRWDREGRRWSQYRIPAGIHFVLGDLAALGMDAQWLSLKAEDVGEPHRRERIFILAYRPGRRCGILRQPSERYGLVGGGAARIWPTPRADCDGTRTPNGTPGKDGRILSQEAASWLTPHGNSNPRSGSGGGEFAKQANQWSTPQSHDVHGPKTAEQIAFMRRGGRAGVRNLNEDVSQWPTPNSSETERGSNRRYYGDDNRTGRMLKAEAELWNTPKAITGGPESAERKQQLGRTESGGATSRPNASSGMWRSPDAPGGGGPRNRRNSIGQGHQQTIAEQAETLWQTPATNSFRSRGGDRRDEMGLDQQARIAWPSPAERDYRTPNLTPYSERGGADEGRAASELCPPLFSPGPADGDGWRAVLATRPWLAPAMCRFDWLVLAARLAGLLPMELQGDHKTLGKAIASALAQVADRESEIPVALQMAARELGLGEIHPPRTPQEAQSLLRRLADDLSRMDGERTDRLRADGNMVVAIQGAAAFLELRRRIITSGMPRSGNARQSHGAAYGR